MRNFTRAPRTVVALRGRAAPTYLRNFRLVKIFGTLMSLK